VRTGDAKGRLTSLPMQFNAHGLWVNEGMFQQYGWTYPKTWDELYTLCGKILAQGIQPLAMNGKDGWNMTTFMHSYIMRKGGIKSTENASYGKDGVKFTDPAFMEAAQMMAKFGQAGYFGKGLTTVDWSGAHDLFLQGQVAMWPETTGASGDLDNAQINKLGIKASLHPYPEVAGGVAPSVQDGYAEANTSIGEVISTGRMDAAFADFLKYVFSRYGNAQLKVAGNLPGFVVTDTSSVPPFLAQASTYLQSRKETTLWFEAKLPPRGVEYSFRNVSLLSLGQLTPQEFMGNIQRAVDDSLAGNK
jgi:raffinose/stachyose/melibiose transport system substrate-binding protein